MSDVTVTVTQTNITPTVTAPDQVSVAVTQTPISVTVSNAETDPIFSVSEAALFETGDKDRLDNLLGGTTFPLSPSTNDRFFRTDLGFDCYYDGVRWLTIEEYPLPLQRLQTSSADVYGDAPAAPRNDYDKYWSKFSTSVLVATTNDGGNYWTVNLWYFAADFGSYSNIHNFTTVGLGVTTNVLAVTPTTPLATSKDLIYWQVTKTGSPGAIDLLGGQLYYRLIIPNP